MSRHAVGARATAIGSSTIPFGSLYCPSGNGGVIREIGIWNTVATEVVVAVQRLTTTGTQGAGLDELDMWNELRAATLTGFNSHTAGPTITAGFFRRASLGAQIGAGVIWTFGGSGLVIPAGTANGIGLTTPNGTGQITDYYIEWEE